MLGQEQDPERLARRKDDEACGRGKGETSAKKEILGSVTERYCEGKREVIFAHPLGWHVYQLIINSLAGVDPEEAETFDVTLEKEFVS